MAYVCGIDIGGTVTDCAIVDDEGRPFPGMAPTTGSAQQRASMARSADSGPRCEPIL